MTSIVKYLKDYRQPDFWVEQIELTFEILSDKVRVSASSLYRKNPNSNSNSLTLLGSAKLIAVKLDQQDLHDYHLTAEELTINNLNENFQLSVVTEIDPYHDKSCSGLYASNGSLFTQCEPEGFRKITYYLDRPDVMAKFTTTIIANSQDYPQLLSNGNLITSQQLGDGRHKVVWEDPFKKPSYLFALVAGKFSQISHNFTTKSGKKVLVEVYSEESSIAQCQHCLNSVIRAMEWDEQRFNLEYDLTRYMIVASNDFNMGAMENKGLNIFNTKYVLAESHTASDSDFINVEAVVGHEYFHNWTGNRVTCRDWFQLSLKEGLTVFRDQEFTADLHNRAVKRINDVKTLRQNQFSEDASALSHPVRPESYIEMNNFYTMTVYEKGAEVVRMYQSILGREGFKHGMALYFKRHDGQAVTCDEFCAAMAEANDYDLSQFMRWYSQAGTPLLTIRDAYDPQLQRYSIDIWQTIPLPSQQSQKEPLLIPLRIGLLAADGQELELILLEGGSLSYPDQQPTLLLTQQHQQLVFKTASRPTPSLLRGFSAPLKIDYPYTQEQLLNLAAHDSDSFNRWEAIQRLYLQVLRTIYAAAQPCAELIPLQLIQALKKTLFDQNLEPQMKSLIASLPSFAELATDFQPLDVVKLNQALNFLRQELANQLENNWLEIYQQMQTSSYKLAEANRRALKNCALNYLLAGKNQHKYFKLLENHFVTADNMTDKFAALLAINDSPADLRQHLLEQFKQNYHSYPLVMDKWFTLQSQSQLPTTTQQVSQLLEHANFERYNPNKLYALVRAFTSNSLYFNTAAGYRLIADEVLRIDKFNPGVASRIAQGFAILSCLSVEYQQLAKPILNEILFAPELSKDVYEIISKTLAPLC